MHKCKTMFINVNPSRLSISLKLFLQEKYSC